MNRWIGWGAILVLAFGLPACSDDDGNGNGDKDGSITEDGTQGGDTSGDAGNGGDAGKDGTIGPDMPICNEVELKASPLSNLLLVVDKSDSMNNPTSGASSRTKMEDLRDAVHFLLDEYGGKIRFGWMAFPYQDDCDPGVVSIPVGDDSVESIRSLVNASLAWGGTPTGESLQNADAHEGLHDTERGNFVVLVTDGMPTCPSGNGNYENDADNALALTAVQTLAGHQIGTFVIGLGADFNSSNPQLLNDMAEAGGHPRAAQEKYYPANSLDDLKDAFQEIGKAVFSCELALDVVPEQPDWIWVYFDGVSVSRDRDHLDGFDYDQDANQIDFYGPACDRLVNGEVDHIDVKMGCRPPD